MTLLIISYSGLNNTPLHRHQDNNTIKKYVEPVISLLVFLMRAKDCKDYNMPLSEDVRQKIQGLEVSLQNQVNMSQAIHAILSAIWLMKWKKTLDNPFPCPTQRLLAILTMQNDGTHKPAIDVTGYLAKFEYCIRLTCLKEIKKLALHIFNGDDEEACNHLQPWFTENTNTPFAQIRSLQHRASAIAYQTMSLPRIWWIDTDQWTELLYKGERLHLDQLRCMFASHAQTIVDLWENKILKGISARVHYESLADDLTNKSFGYSFLTDKRNTCFTDRDILGKAFLADPRTASIFGHQTSGQWIWDISALKGWLRDYAEFQEHLLLRCQTLGGAPGRGTELTGISFCNTKYRQRNLVMLGSHLTLLRCYHKSSALSGQDKLIPHGLDALTSDLIIQSLALARPFAELAIHLCYPHNPDITTLYQTQLFVNESKLFTTDNISNLLSRLSLQHCNIQLKVNCWRHISIAFKRKLGQFAEDLLELDEEDTVDALQAGHSRATENRIYGLSPDALTGASEDILPLFLDASKQWQLILHIIPSGHIIPYSEINLKHIKDFGHSIKSTVKAQDSSMLSQTVSNLMAELTNKVLPEMESRITTKIISMLTPAIEAAMHNVVKNIQHLKPGTTMAIPKSGVNQSNEIHTSNNHRVPTNNEDLDQLYEDFPVELHDLNEEIRLPQNDSCSLSEYCLILG